MHTNSKDIPTTNNDIELYHLTTLNGHDKRKYKTIEGVLEETLLKTFRWEKGWYLAYVKYQFPSTKETVPTNP